MVAQIHLRPDFTPDHMMQYSHNAFESPTSGHRGHQLPPRGFGRGRYNKVWTYCKDSRSMVAQIHLPSDSTPDHMMQHSHNAFESPTSGHRGHQSPQGSVGGRYNKVWRHPGISGGFTGPQIPLSTLYEGRPLLRPVVFVRGEHQKTLFEEVEDILHAPGEEGVLLFSVFPSLCLRDMACVK